MFPYHVIILVDDDPINNLINKRLIAKLEVAERVEDYLEAEKALARLQELDKNTKVLVLLDINMPVMNGWDFLNFYNDQLAERTDKIVMLSSSIDFQDRKKAFSYKQVETFLEKPLTIEKMKSIL
ncbi:response regulator [Cecembia lonarensis]|uniref:Response regulator of citrate/malate metabolism n=1 Tax=Cecembia lonarensis (strain CCUG 58316 / KCTC 22772 / LW9) TaxID=1225176 RepID=K1L300_CECL9|nr:response regulator [Cecembia lonarensis]EKB50740.1 Response regulator of citrate/malate metabolism [Cecembia lonarensis LW9]